MKHTALCLSALSMLSVLPACSGTREADEPKQPNIILFLVDDMGWQETSVPFHTDTTPLNRRYRTPNMERLAERGVKFTNAYACAVSSPSRCSLMSGMNAARHRVTNWTLDWNISSDEKCDSLQLPQWCINGIQNAAIATAHDSVNSTMVTPLPQLLRDAGYRTIHVGKAHYASMTTSGEEPLNMGFDVNIGGSACGGPGSYLASNEYHNNRFYVVGMEEYAREGLFLTEALTRAAIKELDKAAECEQPFYLYMSHYAIHDPYDPDERFVSNYRDSLGQGVYDELLGERLSDAEVNHAALVEGMDKSLGDILDYLDAHPDMAANTVVMFMSDNGGHAIWPRQSPNQAPNYPARSGKGSALMGGVREPMIVSWPGVTEPGTVNDNPVMIEDYFSTILDIAGNSSPKTVQMVDGVSFKDLLIDKSIRRPRTIIWHYPNIWVAGLTLADGYGAYSAILKDGYHLIHFWNDGSDQLYRPDIDVAETNDLAGQLPDLTAALRSELMDSLRAMDAQVPERIHP